jgi:hypothetical protein
MKLSQDAIHWIMSAITIGMSIYWMLQRDLMPEALWFITGIILCGLIISLIFQSLRLLNQNTKKVLKKC